MANKNNNLDNQFNNFFSKQQNKEIPVSNSNKSKPAKQEYKAVRIYPEDYEIFREYAFKERKKIVEVISETLDFRRKHEKE